MKPDVIEPLLEATKFKVQRWTFLDTPCGRVEREVVVHPGAVLILPFLSDTEIVMIHNLRHAVGRELLELPAGTLDSGEDPPTCALRELEEETGYRADFVEPLCEFFTGPGICTELMHAFVAKDLKKSRQRLDATEEIRVQVLGLEEALDMVAAGQIVDGKTIAALTTFQLRKERL